MSRARRQLHLTYTEQSSEGDVAVPSRFLAEVPAECVEKTEQLDATLVQTQQPRQQQAQQQAQQQQPQAEAAAAALPDNEALAAAGWTVYADPTTGLPFYHHTKTGASSWVSPI